MKPKPKITLTKTAGGYYVITKLVGAVTVRVSGTHYVPVGSTIKATEAHELLNTCDVTVIPTKSELASVLGMGAFHQ